MKHPQRNWSESGSSVLTPRVYILIPLTEYKLTEMHSST